MPAAKNNVLAGLAVLLVVSGKVSDHKPLMVMRIRMSWILHKTFKFVGEAVECGDPSAAKIANQDGIAEFAEIARGPHDSPGSIEPIAMLEVPDVLAARGE